MPKLTKEKLNYIRSAFAEDEDDTFYTTEYENEVFQREQEKKKEEQFGDLLGNRWTKLNYLPEQRGFHTATERFVVVPAGRRTGKSEIAKRRGVERALQHHKLRSQWETGWYVFAAPTYNQAKKIFWFDLKQLVPKDWIDHTSESSLSIVLQNGAVISVVGLDKPERLEGSPIDAITIDEFANVKADAWFQNIRPALADRTGTADLIGVPEGRNHYWELYQTAQEDESGTWAAFTWTSEQVLPLYLGEERAKQEIEQAKNDLDEWSYRQEYLASFMTFSGLAYHAFSDENIISPQNAYDPKEPLCIALDFNVEPGTAVLLQEKPTGTVIFDEVYIERDSNTQRVMETILKRYANHEGEVWFYGDPAGDHRKTSGVFGSDWTLVKNFASLKWKDRFSVRVDRSDPGQRMRINATNSRCCNVKGQRRLFVTSNCKYVIRDFQGVTLSDSGLLELDKSEKKLTHLTDAIAYYICRRFGMPSEIKRAQNIEI